MNNSLANVNIQIFFLGSGAFGEVFEGQISGFVTNSSGNQSSSQDQGLGSESKGLSMYFYPTFFSKFYLNLIQILLRFFGKFHFIASLALRCPFFDSKVVRRILKGL